MINDSYIKDETVNIVSEGTMVLPLFFGIDFKTGEAKKDYRTKVDSYQDFVNSFGDRVLEFVEQSHQREDYQTQKKVMITLIKSETVLLLAQREPDLFIEFIDKTRIIK